jgi:hypothetical protein
MGYGMEWNEVAIEKHPERIWSLRNPWGEMEDKAGRRQTKDTTAPSGWTGRNQDANGEWSDWCSLPVGRNYAGTLFGLE